MNKLYCFILSFIILNSAFLTQSQHSMISQTSPAAVCVAASTRSSVASLTTLYSGTLTAKIGDEFYLLDFPFFINEPSFKSSKSSVASIDAQGLITAKKAGTTTITVTYSKLILKYKLTVEKTVVKLNYSSASLDCEDTLKLAAYTSNGSTVTYKTSKKSIAAVDEHGLVTALKPGTATITAKADSTTVTCKIYVKKPVITLDQSSITMHRNQTAVLKTSVSSGLTPVFKSSKKSVAIVDENGNITAIKHGTTVITVSLYGVSKTCIVTVVSPVITLNTTELVLTKGDQFQLKADVSTGNDPFYTSSRTECVQITQDGLITAMNPGTSTITVSEDGIKVKCKVKVIKAS